jgi:ApbE superfamily uncharacterized protein (UPF0280 family)
LIKSHDLTGFQVAVGDTDLQISADRDLTEAARVSIQKYRQQIRNYIRIDPEFQTSLKPCHVDTDSAEIIRAMADAAVLAGVGPFAAVAGAVAEFVGRDLLQYSQQIIIENGGDIFMRSNQNRKVGIYAGDSSLSNQLAIEIDASATPLGICTSTGTVGHSLSFGKADAVVIISKSTTRADAIATATGNRVQSPRDIAKGIEFAKAIEAVSGIVIIIEDQLGVWGDFRLTKIGN